MKAIIIAVVVVGAIVGALQIQSNLQPLVFVNERNVTEVTNIPEIPESWTTDEDAIKAAKDVIRKKELQAALTELDETIEAESVKYKEEVKKRTEERKKLADELATF